MSIKLVSFYKLLLALLAWVCTVFAIDLTTCGTTKTCIFQPQSCTTVNSTCSIFTYQYIPATNSFYMELSGGSGMGEEYNAVAFSPNGLMENSDLYFCTGQSLKTGTIKERHIQPSTDDIELEHLSNIVTITNDGVGECRFNRTASVTKTINRQNLMFDLASNRFHVLQALGEYINVFGFDVMFSHDLQNRWSSGPYNFTETSSEVFQDYGTTILPSVSLTISSTIMDIDTDCGIRRNCYKNPPDCVIGNQGCMFASWIYNSSNNSFEFIIIGGAPGMYAAIAFAPSAQMENADLYYCTENGLRSGAIHLRSFPPHEQIELPSEITQVTNRIENGTLVCSFIRPASVEKPIYTARSIQTPTEFNLVERNWHFLYAVGDYPNQMRYHQSNRNVTSLPINFTTTYNSAPISTTISSSLGTSSIMASSPSNLTTSNMITFPIINLTNFPLISPSISSSPESTNISTRTTFGTSFPSQSISIEINCGNNRSCLKSPADCETGKQGCMFASWFYNKSTNNFEFVITGGAPGMYAAIAFAEHAAMKNADLYYCTEDGLRNGVIQREYVQPLELTELPREITQVTNKIENGTLVCSFIRSASVEKPIYSKNNSEKLKKFNLVERNWHMLYSMGQFSGKLNYHGSSKVLTSSPVNFTKGYNGAKAKIEDTGGSGSTATSRILMLFSLIVVFKVL